MGEDERAGFRVVEQVAQQVLEPWVLVTRVGADRLG
jgi:hypothetical protein